MVPVSSRWVHRSHLAGRCTTTTAHTRTAGSPGDVGADHLAGPGSLRAPGHRSETSRSIPDAVPLAGHRLLARRPGFSRQLLRHEKRLEDAREGDVPGIVVTTQLMK